MQTLERTQDLASLEETSKPPRRTKRTVGLIALGVALIVVAAGVAYAIGSSNSRTKTVVKTVTPNKPVTPAVSCIKGVAPGSCNTDEAAEANLKDQPLDQATRTLLAAQLTAARAAALKYPTVADATAHGMILAGGFSPETGAHYINYAGINSFDPANPGTYIYDGTSPTSRVVGLMYLGGDSTPPAGFAGPNDHWHRHANTCVVFGGANGIRVPFAADSDVTISMCNAQHGTFMRRTTWMVHAWVVPGWESPLGVFSHNNPDLVCADGTIHTDAVGFCKGN